MLRGLGASRGAPKAPTVASVRGVAPPSRRGRTDRRSDGSGTFGSARSTGDHHEGWVLLSVNAMLRHAGEFLCVVLPWCCNVEGKAMQSLFRAKDTMQQ